MKTEDNGGQDLKEICTIYIVIDSIIQYPLRVIPVWPAITMLNQFPAYVTIHYVAIIHGLTLLKAKQQQIILYEQIS